MAYVPQGFQNGEILMAGQLNSMDAQIARNETAAANRDFIANNYDPLATYEKGDLVIYNGTVQVAIVDIPTPEVFTSSHWKLTTMDTQFKETLAEKADIDGEYPDLTVGNAEQIISTQYVENTDIYTHRATGGSADVGNREYLEKIIGGTVCWNQLVENGDFSNDTTRWLVTGLTMSVANGVCTCTAKSDVGNASRLYKQLSVTANHKYILCATIRSNTTASYQFYLGGTLFTNTTSLIPNEWVTVESLNNVDATTSYLYLYCARGGSLPEGNTVDFKNICVFDLTAMFGPTIADYVYGLEQATAGAGVAWFRRYFPNDYYAYNPGELISVSGLQSHDTVGFNAWDEEWELGNISSSTGNNTESTSTIRSKNYITVIPNVRYYIKTSGKTLGMRYYGANKEFLGYAAVSEGRCTFASNVRYIRFFVLNTTVYNHEICIHLEHSGTRNGEYEPYEKHSYPLDSTLTLRGKPKLDANGNLYFDGDEYTSDGVVAKKYGAVNLGTLTWTKSNWLQASATIPDAAASVNNDQRFFTNVDCTINSFNGSVSSTVPFLGVSDSGSIRISLGGLYNDMTVEQFVEAMSNKYLVYPLATQTTEQAEPYQEIQICSDWGTEEFVSDSILPVGHLTRYPANLRDKLQHLPSLADADGDYIVRQSGSQMSLVGLGNTNEVTGIKDDISELRATALAQGIYVDTESQPIVSISDGADDQPMKSVKVAMEPVQDLHGYDAPWPAGGGDCVLRQFEEAPSIEGLTITVNDGKITINGTIADTATLNAPLTNWQWDGTSDYWLSGCPAGGDSKNGYSLRVGSDNAGCYSMYDVGNGIRLAGATANSIVGMDLKFTIVLRAGTYTNLTFAPMLNAGLSAQPYSSYSNVCPITGWTEAKVTRTGKNLIGLSLDDIVSSQRAVNSIEGSTITLEVNGTYSRTMYHAKLVPGEAYTVSFYGACTSDYKRVVMANKQVWSPSPNYFMLTLSETKTYYTRTFIADGAELFIILYASANQSTEGSMTIEDLQIELGSTATEYEPYQGQTYEVTFPADPGTVYGGTLDAASGKLMVDRAVETYDGDENWAAGNSDTFYISIPLIYRTAQTPMCNWLKPLDPGTSGSMPDFSIRFNAGITNLMCKPDSSISTLDGWKTYLAEHPLTVAYLLVEPQEITLTPTEIKTLLGINNVWSDASNTAVTYLADTKMYIDRKIAEAVANALNA